ncbi:MAG TPA: hypothetical protein VIW64_07685 [Pyrinomonadaceae bacterium]|jgi:hypothetical protein
MSVSVTLFNPNELPLFFSVNNGSVFATSGTGPAQNWLPQQPDPNPLGFVDGSPAPNVLGTLGPNQVLIIFGRGPIASPVIINIPQGTQIDSLQLYIFLTLAPTAGTWVMLNAGTPLTWGNISSDEAERSSGENEAYS